MSAWPKLVGFAAVLAAAFAAAFTAGSSADPVAGGASPDDRHRMPATSHDAGGDRHRGEDRHGDAGERSRTAAALPGLAVSDAGYSLQPAATSLPDGPGVPFEFQVTGPDGAPVTSYVEKHEKELHLVVVRRDLATFAHVHPVRAADGTWRVPLDLRDAGTYRVFADFQPVGTDRGLTLGVDVSVAGSFGPVPLPAPARTTSVDGFTVSVDGAQDVRAGEETELAFSVTRGGREVTDLQPYLGAFGHLVSLRSGDLAYLHTHPVAEAHGDQRGGPTVRFATEFPTAGTYRLFLDFRVDGTVRTAALTVSVEEDS